MAKTYEGAWTWQPLHARERHAQTQGVHGDHAHAVVAMGTSVSRVIPTPADHDFDGASPGSRTGVTRAGTGPRYAEEPIVVERPATCPIPLTHDKFHEAHYFLGRILDEYHQPMPFRWNLNAFLQSLRAVTLMLQKELHGHQGFHEWYEPRRQQMQSDSLLRRCLEGRNLIAHHGSLRRRSLVEMGVFRYREFKLGLAAPLDIDVPSAELLGRFAHSFTGKFIDEEHSAIGEQFGIRRNWIVDDLTDSDEEIVSVCHRALARISVVVASAHQFAGSSMQTMPEEGEHVHSADQVNVLLESDVDPTLLEKWGW
jgi:hypothetical protein